MSSPPIISVISSLATDQFVTVERLPDPGESFKTSGLYTRCGGKGANTSVAAARLSRKNPNKHSDSSSNNNNSNNNNAADPSSAPAPPITNGLPNDDGVDFSDNGAGAFPGTSSARAGGATSTHDVEVQVRLIGAVGKDERRLPLLENLQRNRVDTSGVVETEEHATGLCIGIIDLESGENRLLITPGANLHLRPRDFLTLDSLAGGYRPDIVVCNLVIARETTEQVLETAHAHGVSTLLNPSPVQYLLRPVYRMVSHLIVNETEAAMLTDQTVEDLADMEGWASVADKFLNMGVRNVVVTLGAKGAYYSNQVGRGGYVEAEKDINVQDVTGAG